MIPDRCSGARLPADWQEDWGEAEGYRVRPLRKRWVDETHLIRQYGAYDKVRKLLSVKNGTGSLNPYPADRHIKDIIRIRC